MAVTNNSELAKKIRLMSLHGLSKAAWKRFTANDKRSYDVVDIGYKFNMTDIQASIGICQVNKLDKMSKIRDKIWDLYLNSIDKNIIEMPAPPMKDCIHAKHLFNIGLPPSIDREKFLQKASSKYQTLYAIHYKSIPSFSVNKEMGIFEGNEDLCLSKEWGEKNISLSLSAAVSDKEVEKTINVLEILLNDAEIRKN